MRITDAGRLDVHTNLPVQGTYNSQYWVSSNSSFNLKLQTVWNNSGINYNFVQKFNGVDYNSLSFYEGNVGIGISNPNKKTSCIQYKSLF